MRAPHALLVLLILAAVGSQLYVQLNYDYADAPQGVKLALLVGAGAMALLALLLGPQFLKRRL